MILRDDFKTMDDLKLYYGPDLKIDLGCGYYKPPGFIGLDNCIGFGSQIKNNDNFPDILNLFR
jgi:hypothetical protein